MREWTFFWRRLAFRTPRGAAVDGSRKCPFFCACSSDDAVLKNGGETFTKSALCSPSRVCCHNYSELCFLVGCAPFVLRQVGRTRHADLLPAEVCHVSSDEMALVFRFHEKHCERLRATVLRTTRARDCACEISCREGTVFVARRRQKTRSTSFSSTRVPGVWFQIPLKHNAVIFYPVLWPSSRYG